jgi:membrane protein DedA with SNARE-associated domain
MLKTLLDWYLDKLDAFGYWLIGFFMFLESTFLPIPSEFVIPPAAYLAHDKGRFTYFGIILAGTIGSWLGGAAMYWIARLAGRPFLLKYGRYFFISEDKIYKMDRWTQRFGPFGVFIARLLPVVRHLIGIPMGVAKMNFKLYSIYTILGSAIWCSVLTWVGVMVGNNMDKLKHDMKLVTLLLVGAVALMSAIYYFFVHRHMKDDTGAKA